MPVQIGKKYLALLAVLVAANIVLAGLLYLRYRDRPADPMAPRAGFAYSDIRVPDIPTNDPHHWDAVDEGGLKGEGFSLASRYLIGTAYAVWGGELACWLRNTGNDEIFVYGLRLEGDWGYGNITVGMIIQPGEERYVGLVHFPGPAQAGNRSCTLKTGLMTLATMTGPFYMSRYWYDQGWVGNSSRFVDFLPLGEKPHYSVMKNPGYYFDKANRLVSPGDTSVTGVTTNIIAAYPGKFNIYQAAAAFDFVHWNVTYVNDPTGRDIWSPPKDTLARMSGDCEDYALLLSGLIMAMNGTTRFHMEADHAFLSVYVGTDIGAVRSALERYYNTALEMAYFQDGFGYWLAADSTSSMYLGGLPLGGQPLASGWDLTNTTFHYTIDMMPS